MREPGLAVRADGHHSARHAHRAPLGGLGGQFFRRPRREGGKHLGQGVAQVKPTRVRLEAEFRNGHELLLALRAEFVCVAQISLVWASPAR